MAEDTQDGGEATEAAPRAAEPAAYHLALAPSGEPAFDAGFNFDGVLNRVGATAKHVDLGFALGLVAILVVLIMPMTPCLIDIALDLSITLSVLIMMTVVMSQNEVYPMAKIKTACRIWHIVTPSRALGITLTPIGSAIVHKQCA